MRNGHMKMGLFHLAAVLFLIPAEIINYTYAENMLIVMPLPSPSHFKSFQPLFEELVLRGHNVTLLSPFSLADSLREKYTLIDIRHLVPKLNIVFANMRKQNRLENQIFCSDRVQEFDEEVLSDPLVQSFIESAEHTKFDVVATEIFYTDVMAAFAYNFDAPLIALSAQGVISFYTWILRNPLTASHLPNMYLPFTHKMSFSERLINSVFNLITVLHHELLSLPVHQKQMETYFHFEKRGKKVPALREILQNTTITLTNSHFTFGYAKANLPNIIEIAGLHLTPPKTLPKPLQEFMDKAKDGVIYVSLGSLIQPEDAKSVGNSLVKILKKFPQNVVFKWKADLLEEIPENFLIQEWTPQTSVLKHPNCRVFITHGGFHSLVESVIYAVPLIGVPFFTDQMHNVGLVEHLQIGKRLDLEEIDVALHAILNEILINPKYKTNIKLQSRIFNDRLITPLDTAVYWFEYVVRYKGTNMSHMKSSALELPWYEYCLLDVISVLLIALMSVVFTLYLTFKLVVNFVNNIKNHFAETKVAKKSKPE